jgi:two-component system, probable response regulator PhcQ
MSARPAVVLLVDDEPPTLNALSRLLRSDGHQVLTTSDPLQAPIIVESGKVDIVVSDMDMPEMNGLELMAQLRQSAPHVVRILLTGRGSLAAAMRAINEGEVFRFLTKPWNNDELRSTIKEAEARLREPPPAVQAANLAERRSKLLAELEQTHPGITQVDRVDGVYELSNEQARATLLQLQAEPLAGLWPTS